MTSANHVIYHYFLKNHFSACPTAGRMNLFGRHGNGDCDTDQSDDVVNPAKILFQHFLWCRGGYVFIRRQLPKAHDLQTFVGQSKFSGEGATVGTN